MNFAHKISRGFSAIEVIIVIFISSVVILAVFEIYITYNATYAIQNANINTYADASSFLNDANDMMLQADAILSSRAFSGTTYTTGSTTVVLEIPSINSSGDIISNTHDYAVLFSSSTSAYRILEANGSSARVSGTKKFSDLVTNLSFLYDNGTPTAASSITIDITTQQVAKQETVTSHLKHKVYLRNK